MTEYRRFGDTVVMRIDRGEEILAQLKKMATAENIRLASVRALGAVGDFTVGVFKTGVKKDYANHFTGDEKGCVFGDHLNEAVVSATCEMVVEVIDGTVDRQFDPDVGLNLFKFCK